ncbi:MAG TPA: dolichyl-phosphate beta-glucosyltransferase, partial [Myxococcota bacterium]|nr:dolichyl-phosphate beta-glucosyltransferase [Myxococcota bacterium]
MSGAPISLSLIVPAFDEGRRIGASLRHISSYLEARTPLSEIVVVDDGSRDRTAEIVRELAPGLGVPVCLARYAPNRGKGAAVKLGFALARGDRIVFMDADLSTPIEMLEPLLCQLDAGSDVVIGSRKMPGAHIAVRQPWLRETLGKVFTWLVHYSIAPFSDVTCGFKGFRSAAGREVFARARVERWSFDAEILMLARRLGYRIAELPVRWEDRAASKVRLRRDVIGSL